MIYPVDSIVHLLKDWSLVLTKFKVWILSELKIFLYLMLNVAYQNQLHLSHLLPRLKLFIPPFHFYCSSYFMGSSGHLGHLDVMPCPFLWQWQLGKIPRNSENKPRGLYFSKALFEGLISGGAYIRRDSCIPGFLKTGSAKMSTHFTTWQFKTTKLIQRPIKSRYLTLGSKLVVPRSRG